MIRPLLLLTGPHLVVTLLLLCVEGLPLAPEVHRNRYPIDTTRVIDGDTFVAWVGLGLNAWLRDEKIRLKGVDTPELDEPGGKEARDFTKAWLEKEGDDAYLEADKRDNFGRILGVVVGLHGTLNQALIDAGHVKQKKQAPRPPPDRESRKPWLQPGAKWGEEKPFDFEKATSPADDPDYNYSVYGPS